MFEVEDPALKSLPLAVQQKQIIVTCNYEARRRGLHKLQLIKEARKVCPEVIIILGEDLTRFRNASKDLYNFLRPFVWSQKAERLGFDEVFMDMSDVVDYNVALLNHNDLSHSFFHLDQADPTVGFSYDASKIIGRSFPSIQPDAPNSMAEVVPPSLPDELDELLEVRLRLGSHLAHHIRAQLEEQKGYTATVGISTNKLLSKLVGNIHKPNDQTTLISPYTPIPGMGVNNVKLFIDSHDIGKLPGIGFKMAQKIRNYVLGRPAKFDSGLVYGGTKESVLVKDVRLHPSMGSEILEDLIGGPGSPKGIGERVWGLINGIDDTEVGMARNIPRQISIEDSYIRLDTLGEVKQELRILSESLLRRMRVDLTEIDDDRDISDEEGEHFSRNEVNPVPWRWLAHPRTLRISTRPRPPLLPDGTRSRSFKRISRSCPMPAFVFGLNENIDSLAETLVHEALLPSFRKLHPEPSGWNLSLVNIAAVNMMAVGSDDKNAGGRDISRMFRRQDEVLKPWKVEDIKVVPSEETNSIHSEDSVTCGGDRDESLENYTNCGKEPCTDEEALRSKVDVKDDDTWDCEEEPDEGTRCQTCGLVLPDFAIGAHERYHMNPD